MIRSFFTNRSVNFLTLHFGLQFFASSLLEVFFGIYLYKLGFPIWMIFLIWGSIFITRILLRPFSLKLCQRWGLRKVLILGTLIYAGYFLILARANAVDLWLLLLILTAAVTDIFYWLPYHTYFSILGDLEHRGKQIALREAAVFLAAFLAPLVGALLISAHGFASAFWSATLMMLFAVLPLLRTPEVALPPGRSIREICRRTGKEGFWLYLGDSIFSQAYGFTWKLVLFFMIKDYLPFGGLLSLAVLFQIIGVAFIGQSFDSGGGRKLYPFGVILMILVVIGRVFFTRGIPEIIFFDALFALGVLVYTVTNSAFYNVAKKSSDPLGFQFLAESGWDIGATVTTFLAAAFVYLGGDLRFVMLLGIPGFFITWRFLRRYYSS